MQRIIRAALLAAGVGLAFPAFPLAHADSNDTAGFLAAVKAQGFPTPTRRQ
jgi:hypothetical protein